MTEQNIKALQELGKLPGFRVSALLKHYQKQAESGWEISENAFGGIQGKCGNGGKRILLLFRYMPGGVMITKQEKENMYLASVLGNRKPEHLDGQICFCDNREVGILRREEKSGIKIEMFPEITPKPGEIYELRNEIICKPNLLYTHDVSRIIPRYIVDSVVSTKEIYDKEIYFTLVNESISSIGGYVEAVRRVKPEITLLFSVIPEQDTCKAGGGAVVVVKDGNAVVSEEVQAILEGASEDSVQRFVGKTDTVLEQISIAEGGGYFGEIGLPVKYAGSPCEEIFWDDVEKTRNLLLKTLWSL